MGKRVSKLLNLTHKVCTLCGVNKDASCFRKRKLVSGIALSSNCKDCRKEIETEWSKNNIKRVREIKRKWKETHKEKYKESERKRSKFKYKNDPNYRIRLLLRRRFKEILGHKKINLSAIKLLGCSIEYFKSYIESQFVEDMNWDNHGQFGWHIDHIKPLYSFDFVNNPESIKEAFHYTNMRPLWWKENIQRNKNRNNINA